MRHNRICRPSEEKRIGDEIDDYYASEVNHGRLYPDLDNLVEKGLVDKSKKDDRTNEYTLTNRGRGELESRREWEAEIARDRLESVAA